MAVSSGRTGIGVLLQLGTTGGSPTYSTVGGVTELQAGGTTVNVLDATHLASPDMYSEKLPSLKSADDVTFTLQYDDSDTVQASLRDIFEDREKRIWKLNTDAVGLTNSLTFNAYISQLGNVTISPDQIMTQSVTLSVTGKYTEVAN